MRRALAVILAAGSLAGTAYATAWTRPQNLTRPTITTTPVKPANVVRPSISVSVKLA